MNWNYKEILPKWFEEQTNNELVLSDDLDSLVSCAILNKVKGWKIRYFYDFENLYKSDQVRHIDTSTRVWVDVAALNGEKAFDNHISMVTLSDLDSNDLMINPNKFCMITNENYTDKYCGSTALLLWSLYDLPLPETEEGKMLLLTIDSTFLGYWHPKFKDKYRDRNKFFLCDVFGLDELYKVQERHTYEEFENVRLKYETTRKIKFKNRTLHTLLDLDRISAALGVDLNIIADDSFVVWTKYKIVDKQITKETKVSDISADIFSLAFTFRNSVRYSQEIPDEEWLFKEFEL